jgi:hypothetical protein
MLEGLLETWVPGFQQQQLLEAWGDVVDMLDLRNDERLLIGNYMSGGTVQDRKDGRNLPIFQNDQDLASIRANARLICDVVPTAIGALKHLKNYIIHTGMTYRVVSEDGVKVDPGLIRAAQRVIDKFQDRHDWRGDLENELFIRSRRDGEFCLRFWFQNDGTTDVRPVEPEQIHDDGRTEEGRSFSFGVDSPSTDVCRADGYLIEDSAGT